MRLGYHFNLFPYYLYFILTQEHFPLLIFFRARGSEDDREGERQTHQLVASVHAQTGNGMHLDQVSNSQPRHVGSVPGWESNPQPLIYGTVL